ncbi:hypothetical protein WBK31_12480 [Nonomuraea sp. N2-4H]|jgi:hypothetical protein|uniref:ABC transporter substrate-binding protein n=1 Tax=unclassified Nonomuraea TaxID=2593643 RepID=UPI00324756B3
MTQTLLPLEENPWPRPPRRRWGWIVAGVCAVVLLAYGGFQVVDHLSRCAPGVARVTVAAAGREECVGISDSYAFEPRFQHVVNALITENEFATAGGEGTYVTVAFAAGLTNPDGRVVAELEGAVAGLRRANRENLVGSRPLIKMVLANMDSEQTHWQEVTDDLLEMVDGPDRLRAVVGLGLSSDEAVNGMRRLSEAELPMIADVMTADDITKKQANGFARVNPTVGEELAAVAQYVRTTEERTAEQRSAMMVTYSEENDRYAAALSNAFKTRFGEHWKRSGRVSNPFSRDPGINFDLIVGSLCDDDSPDLILYGGRGKDLPAFIQYLSQRKCHDDEVTIVTGSDAARLLTDSPENKPAVDALYSQEKPISLIYSPLAEPAVLRGGAGQPAEPQLVKLEQTFRDVGFDPRHLRTGWAIMAHDAVLVAARAIRLAALSNPIPPPRKVRDHIYLMSPKVNGVQGASGLIEIDPETGNRRIERLPVLRLLPRGEPEILGLYPVR